MKLLLLCSVICVCFPFDDAAKILAIFPAPTESHVILGSALLKGLAAKGHQVTMVSPYPLTEPVKNYRDIVMGDLKSMLLCQMGKGFHWKGEGEIQYFKFKIFHEVGVKLTTKALEDMNFQKLLLSDEKFDLVIAEIFLNEAFLALGHHFDAPVVGFSSTGPSMFTQDVTGNPSPHAYVPEFILGYSDHMTFFQRTMNTISATLMTLYRHFIYVDVQNEIKEKHFPGSPHLRDIMNEIPLVLHNSHVSLGYPQPMVPAVVEIGGFHIRAPQKLPDDLQKYLDEATEGVVLFSMGSNLKSTDMPVAEQQAFIEAFSQMKEKILWKWEDESIPDQPKNLKISKWLPQQDILAHPNVKAFITHGGLLSTTEAVFRGVPVVGIPIYGDQFTNMMRAQNLGYGLMVKFNNVTTTSITWALREILDNPSYRNVVKQRSIMLQDQEVPPLEKAVFWVEYVLRHGDARHLRVASKDLSFIQNLLLDVLAFILAIVTFVISIIYYSCKMCCSKNRTKDKKPNSSQNKNQKKKNQ